MVRITPSVKVVTVAALLSKEEHPIDRSAGASYGKPAPKGKESSFGCFSLLF